MNEETLLNLDSDEIEGKDFFQKYLSMEITVI